ncbi:MAG TPA: hypothetical protein PLP23_08865 [Panacibacter sp.]|nr:hypothetical protein [Panacibacter sp.]
MALDFHRLDNKKYLFGLDDKTLDALGEIFEMFTHWTGLVIDPYGDLKLPTENQQTLITIIDKYIEKTDLNKDKAKTSTILEFKGLLKYFSRNKIDLELLGD